MAAKDTLGELANLLLSGSVEVVDLAVPLGEKTPLIKLPPPFKNTPPVKVHTISNYDADGPYWSWNWLELGEHSGTHFDAPHHWITGKDFSDGATDTLPVQKLVAPVNVIDCSKETAADEDFLLSADGVKAWEKQHGAINKGEWVVMRTGWFPRNRSEAEFLNVRDNMPHSPGPTVDCMEYMIGKGIVGWGTETVGTDAGKAGHVRSALPGAQPPSQEQPLRPREPRQPRQAAGEGRDPDRGAAEIRQRHRKPDPRAGAGAEALRSADDGRADYIIVGSGINGLTCAALLGKKGRRVLVLERESVAGGCMRTEAATAPGYLHDVMATTFVLFITSPAFAKLGPDLARHGLEFAHIGQPTGVLLPDGRSLVLSMDRAANVAKFNALAAGDGDRYRADVETVERDAALVFGLLGGALWTRATLKLLLREAWRRGPRGLAARLGEGLRSGRTWLETRYESDLVRALFAPWVLHAGLGPENAFSGEIARVIAFALEAAGAPIVKGGAANAVAAFKALIEAQGGEVRTGADVVEIVISDGGASGVRVASGETLTAARGVICSVTPTQLYERLLPKVDAEDDRDRARRTIATARATCRSTTR